MPQGLLLHGDDGVGLKTIAKYLADERITTEVNPEQASSTARPAIAIETVRNLYVEARGKSSAKQVILIDDADAMTLPAQQALLKLLEEPQAHIRFILTSHAPDRLLSTIRSRLQQVHIPRVSPEQSRQLVADESVKRQAQLLFVANGRPALINRLKDDETALEELTEIIRDARQFIEGSTYEKSVLAIKYGASTEKALHLLDSAIIIIKHALYSAPTQQHIAMAGKLEQATLSLGQNQNAKLQLLRVVLQ